MWWTRNSTVRGWQTPRQGNGDTSDGVTPPSPPPSLGDPAGGGSAPALPIAQAAAVSGRWLR